MRLLPRLARCAPERRAFFALAAASRRSGFRPTVIEKAGASARDARDRLSAPIVAIGPNLGAGERKVIRLIKLNYHCTKMPKFFVIGR
jgi:hypothetical protein